MDQIFFFHLDQVYQLASLEAPFEDQHALEIQKISKDMFDWDALDEACWFPVISMHEL